MGLRPTSSPIVHDARYEIRFADRLVGQEFVRRVQGASFTCIEGRIRQTAPEPIELAYDLLRIGGRLESLALRFELAGVEVEHEAWRRGDRWVSTTRRFGRSFKRSDPLPVLVDLGTPLSWVDPELPDGSFPLWVVRPPELVPARERVEVGPSGSTQGYVTGGAKVWVEWSKDADWPSRVTVERRRWGQDRLHRSRDEGLSDGSPFAPRLEGRCPTEGG